MTEAATTATKGGTATHSAFRSGLPNVGIPKFAAPKIEVPAAFRDLAQNRAKDNYEKMQAPADEMTSILEQAYATAAKGVTNWPDHRAKQGALGHRREDGDRVRRADQAKPHQGIQQGRPIVT
jgi:hypothetical protein